MDWTVDDLNLQIEETIYHENFDIFADLNRTEYDGGESDEVLEGVVYLHSCFIIISIETVSTEYYEEDCKVFTRLKVINENGDILKNICLQEFELEKAVPSNAKLFVHDKKLIVVLEEGCDIIFIVDLKELLSGDRNKNGFVQKLNNKDWSSGYNKYVFNSSTIKAVGVGDDIGDREIVRLKEFNFWALE